MIYAVVNTKGGVGKTTIAVNLATLLAFREKKFKIVELDNSNNSMIFSNSEILNQDTAVSLQLDQKTRALGSMMFNLAKNKDMDFILDLGGGDDSKVMIESLKEIDLPKIWIVPTASDKKYLKNAADTFKLIADSQNTIFVLNKANSQNHKTEFMYFFGSQKYGVKMADECFENAKYFVVQSSPFFQIAEDDEQTLLDLAMLSIEKNEQEVTAEFIKMAGDDEAVFIGLWEKYEKSKEAAKLFLQIQKNAKKVLKI